MAFFSFSFSSISLKRAPYKFISGPNSFLNSSFCAGFPADRKACNYSLHFSYSELCLETSFSGLLLLWWRSLLSESDLERDRLCLCFLCFLSLLSFLSFLCLCLWDLASLSIWISFWIFFSVIGLFMTSARISISFCLIKTSGSSFRRKKASFSFVV